MVGQYGGGAFVAVYLFFLMVLGVPVLTMELEEQSLEKIFLSLTDTKTDVSAASDEDDEDDDDSEDEDENDDEYVDEEEEEE